MRRGDGSDLPWQQRKSALTRDAILQAAVDCLVDQGYAGLTTIEVTKRAGISRGAMHHHFANRTELVAALIDYVLHKRLEFFLSEYVTSLKSLDAPEALALGTEINWQSMLRPEFTAYLELAMAARTDTALADILVPATKAFDREWSEEMERTYPQWAVDHQAMHLASDIVIAVHVGLLINRPFMEGTGRRKQVQERLVQLVEAMYRDVQT